MIERTPGSKNTDLGSINDQITRLCDLGMKVLCHMQQNTISLLHEIVQHGREHFPKQEMKRKE